MTTHASTEAGTSQCDTILSELRCGSWVDMPRLCRRSGSYNVHSRIADLRKRGHVIEHRNVFTKRESKRVVRSQYRLMQPSPSEA